MTLPLKYLLKSDSVFSGSLLYVFYQEAWDFARGLFSEGVFESWNKNGECSKIGKYLLTIFQNWNIVPT